MSDKADKIHFLMYKLRDQANMVATSGSPSDQFEFVLVSLEIMAKLLYIYNIDDDFLGEINKLLEDIPSQMNSDAESVHDYFYYTQNYLLPRMLSCLSSGS